MLCQADFCPYIQISILRNAVSLACVGTYLGAHTFLIRLILIARLGLLHSANRTICVVLISLCRTSAFTSLLFHPWINSYHTNSELFYHPNWVITLIKKTRELYKCCFARVHTAVLYSLPIFHPSCCLTSSLQPAALVALGTVRHQLTPCPNPSFQVSICWTRMLL